MPRTPVVGDGDGAYSHAIILAGLGAMGIAADKDSRGTPVALIESTRALIHGRRFADAADLIAEFLTSAPGGSAAPIARSLHELCAAAAEHRRTADRLEAGSRAHVAAELELRPVAEAVLASWRTALEVSADPEPPRPPAAPPASPAPRPDVEVRTLGSLEVTIRGHRVERWGSMRARAIFQYVVLHAERPVRREVLMETFWSGHTHDSARNNLNVSVYNLRRTLRGPPGRHAVRYADGCYVLDLTLAWWIDRDELLRAFARAAEDRRLGRREEAIEAYREGLALYRGPLLDDDAISEWHLDEQRYLEDARLAALEEVGELHLELGDPRAAEQAAREALVTDHCRESAHRLIMRCYARNDQHHLVSRQLKICVTTLRRELGITPAPETIHVFESLTSRASSLH
jgi:DNA-binding SARP family transcriptional activator